METPKTKKCKFCQSELPQKASVCPQCGKKQGGKAKWVIAVIVVLLIFSALVGGEEKPTSSGENPPVAENSTPSDTGKTEETAPVEIMEVSPADLLSSYEANEVTSPLPERNLPSPLYSVISLMKHRLKKSWNCRKEMPSHWLVSATANLAMYSSKTVCLNNG